MVLILKLKLEDKVKMNIKNYLFSIKEKSVGSKEIIEIKLLGISIRKRNKQKEIEKKIERLKYLIYKNISNEKKVDVLSDFYFEETGDILNLKNPQNFNEKIQWLKLYDNSNLKETLSDKYLVRNWIKEKIGEKYLIPLYGVWNNFDEIDFLKLPKSFVLKCNHGSGYNILVKDKSLFDKNDAKFKINKWLNENYAYVKPFEFQYKDIKKKIIAEEYIDIAKNSIDDYKLWCFNGKVHYIQFITGRNRNQRMAFFDKNWM